jgi:hypothetical protein
LYDSRRSNTRQSFQVRNELVAQRISEVTLSEERQSRLDLHYTELHLQREEGGWNGGSEFKHYVLWLGHQMWARKGK